MVEHVAGLDVSRETWERLQHYSELILKWNKTINLVARSTETDVWQRHIVDSAQIMRFCPPNIKSWVDIGAGGGLPGIVVAILMEELQPDCLVTLIESDQRKSAFLRSASRELSLKTKVIAQRVESIHHLHADVLSARALAPVSDLLGYTMLHLHPKGTALFMKGRNHAKEVSEARQKWEFDVVAHPSLTDNEASILEIRKPKRVDV